MEILATFPILPQFQYVRLEGLHVLALRAQLLQLCVLLHHPVLPRVYAVCELKRRKIRIFQHFSLDLQIKLEMSQF